MSSRVDREAAIVELQARLDPEAYLQDVLGIATWTERGDELVMHCPLPFGMHTGGDRNPSSAFNRVKLVFGCFVCGGGDILWLTQTMLGVGRNDAMRALRDVLGPDDEPVSDTIRILEAMWAEPSFQIAMPTYAEALLRPWRCYSAYLDERAVSRDVQRLMQTGVDLEHRERLAEDVWIEQPRLVIPHFFRGKLRGWQKRKLDDQLQSGPKYRSSPSFPKDSTLYNFDGVDHDHVIAVESPVSTLRMLTEGVSNVVGTFGASVTDDQVRLLRRFNRVTLFFDADAAGRKATFDVAARLEAHTRVFGVPSWKIWPDERGKDPGDLSRDVIEDCVANAEPAFLIEGEIDGEARDRRQSAQAGTRGAW